MISSLSLEAITKSVLNRLAEAKTHKDNKEKQNEWGGKGGPRKPMKNISLQESISDPERYREKFATLAKTGDLFINKQTGTPAFIVTPDTAESVSMVKDMLRADGIKIMSKPGTSEILVTLPKLSVGFADDEDDASVSDELIGADDLQGGDEGEEKRGRQRDNFGGAVFGGSENDEDDDEEDNPEDLEAIAPGVEESVKLIESIVYKAMDKFLSESVIEKIDNKWRIRSAKTGKLWNAHYDTKAEAEAGLRAYQANKG